MKLKYLVAFAAVAMTLAVSLPALGSSHREAPQITEMPKVDATDFYMFRSYEAGREGFVTLIANYVPLQDPYGGPNYFALDPEARYNIHIDKDGDGTPNMTFEFRFENRLKGLAIPVGDETIAVPLINIGQISGVDDPTLNLVESYEVRLIRARGDRRGTIEPAGDDGVVVRRNARGTVLSSRARSTAKPMSRTESLLSARDGEARFLKPVDNIGEKSIPDYDSYASQFIYDVEIPGCDDGRVFVGQRKDPFVVNLGETFDLVNIAAPIGAVSAETDDLDDKNVTSLVLEVPIDCLKGEGDVVGGWTTATLPRVRVLGNRPDSRFRFRDGLGMTQVSRLGMPLVNEVVIGLPDKDAFNASMPKNDGRFASYVTNPTLPELLEILFGAAGVQAPNNFPRADLVATFVTGIPGVNELGFGEMQRLNTAIAPTPAGAQNNLGVIGGDLAGFPNGRRPGDDVVDVELRVAMGLLCHALPGAFCVPEDAPSGLLEFTDGAFIDESFIDPAFPYLKSPIPGSPNN